MAKKVKLNPYRVILQWTIVVLLVYLLVRPFVDKSYTADFEAYCPFGGLQAFSSFLANNSLACSMTTTQIFMGFGLLVGVILVSKLFCSHICPIGSFTEWLSRVGKKIKLNIVLTGWLDRSLRALKYGLLFITFYFSVTSSELFCKTFDPYYAVFSGFSSDVVVSYAALALLLAIPGSLFIRQFWCRYVCPLGAVSNIFTYSYIFIGITLLYILLTVVFKISIHWLWLLGALTIAGLLLELFKVDVKGMSFFKITRTAENCTNCKLCNKACPMSIDIANQITVRNIDCHLCGDCVESCPEKKTLRIIPLTSNIKKEKESKKLWIPAAIIVVIISLGLAFSERVHIPTVSIKWGDENRMAEAAIYSQEGLTSIKCFGSSMSFANHMKEVPGVMGVETYVGNHSVRIWYDESEITAEDVKKAIFTPVKRIFNSPYINQSEVSVCEAAIDNFFDPNDAFLLSKRFSQNNGILAIQTQFGEPVHALVYYDETKITISEIRKIIEAGKVEWKDEAGEHLAKTNYQVAFIDKMNSIAISTYLSDLYEPVELVFNDYDNYNSEELTIMTIPFSEGAKPELEGMPWYLLSHLSSNRGIVSFKTLPTDTGFFIELTIVKGMTSEEDVIKLLRAKDFNVHLSDGTKTSIKNPYNFGEIAL